MRKKVGYVLLIVMLFTSMMSLNSCKWKNQSPTKKMVQDALLANLPQYLSLNSIEIESIPTGTESFKVNFKAIVTPKEDLYMMDREVQGTPKIILLKVTQTIGTKSSLYGFLEASRTMDVWTLGLPQIDIGLQQFGTPRGTFPPHSYITGSDEAKTALKKQAENAVEEERERKAAMERQELELKSQQEREALERKKRQEQEALEQKEREERDEQARIAAAEKRKIEEEQQRKEEEEARQKLINATAEGTRYIGTISRGDKLQRLRLIFTEQKDFLIRAEASNPDRRGVKQTFIGKLVFDPKPEEGKPNVAYPIVLSPIGEQKFKDADYNEVWNFYRDLGYLKLYLTDIGLEGEACIGTFGHDDYVIQLQRGDLKDIPRDQRVTIPPIQDKKEKPSRRTEY